MILGEQYAAIRCTRGDGNCFFRSFVFSYLEHILDSQDQAEVDCIKAKVEECRKTLQSLGYTDFTFEDFFVILAKLANGNRKFSNPPNFNNSSNRGCHKTPGSSTKWQKLD
ncbi:hypothetical protein EZV62_012005 [Acer yangbiense]|uniref:OTU domain-containing protein n=1 Tax=Acer yangbiense TaxID=1000413 RepID=A0A5C7I717_9ROSI|nr:hypothetical protein EZV62_012005 [Acer yangbiense]